MSDERHLDDLAAAVLAGTPVDWDAEESGASVDDRPMIGELRLLARVAALARNDEAEPSPQGLTDAPRAAHGRAASWGHLELIELIGEGAFGEVYRAWDTRLDREVALKLLPQTSLDADDPPDLEEARLLARVRHPNVVTVHGADRVDGRVGLWTEFVPGRTLEDVLRRQGPCSAQEAALVGVDLCRALSAVHRAGLLHRDVKAQNVMREEEGRIVLMDFGMVRRDVQRVDGPDNTGGTPLYMAPELFDHRPATAATDVYALGVLLYHLVTASYPVTGRTVDELRDAHVSGRRGRLADTRPDLPANFIRVVEQALLPDPCVRIQSASEMETALASVLAPQAGIETAREPGVRAHRIHRHRWALVPAAIGLMVLVGSYLVSRQPAQGGAAVRSGARSGAIPSQPADSGPAGAAPLRLANPPVASIVPPKAVAFERGWSYEPRSWVVVGAFENRTNQAQLDGAIEAALERELSASQFVRVAPAVRIQDLLRLMKSPPSQVLTPSVALEVCRRDGFIAAVVTGRVSKVGERFLLEAKIVESAGGSTVAAVAEEAASEAELLPAVRRISSRVRDRLGESQDQIAASTQILERVTTPSMEAVRLYSASVRAAGNNDNEASLALARAAVERDPAFASGHAWIALRLLMQQKREEAAAAIDRASALADTASEPEQLFIQAVSQDVQGRSRDAASAYEAYLRLRPDDVWAINRLIVFYGLAQRNDDVVRAFAHAADLRPNDFVANGWAAWYGMIYGGRRAEIQPYLARARALIGPESAPSLAAWLRLEPAFEDWMRGDARKAADRLDGAARSEETESTFLNILAGLNIALGRLRAADAVLDRLSGDTSLLRAEIAWWRGDVPAAQTAFRRFLSSPTAAQVGVNRLAAFMVRVHMVDEARSLVAGQPEKIKLSSLAFPPAEGELALAAGDVERAVERLAGYDKLARGIPAYVTAATTYAEALERHGDLREAARVLENLAAARTFMYKDAYLPIALWVSGRARLARVYQALGRRKEAQAVNAELRRLLACADADFVLLRAIDTR